MLEWPLYTPSPNRECLYKVASPGKNPWKNRTLCWTGHFIPPPPTENASIKWPVQVKPLKKENLCWNGHFIPPPPTENASIKWPVQVKPLKKRESMLEWPLYTPSPNRECLYKVASPGKTPEKNTFLPGMATLYPSQSAPGLWPGNGRTDNKVQGENYNGEVQREGYHKKMRHVTFIIRLLFSMCHIDWRWLVYWICCRCILEHMYTYDSHININIYKS